MKPNLQNFVNSSILKDGRRSYPALIRVNGRWFNEILIDPHYEANHSDSINDQIILLLVGKLAGRQHDAEYVDPKGYEYYIAESLKLNGKPYRLVWLTHPDKSYIGVINAFRRNHGKSSKLAR